MQQIDQQGMPSHSGQPRQPGTIKPGRKPVPPHQPPKAAPGKKNKSPGDQREIIRGNKHRRGEPQPVQPAPIQPGRHLEEENPRDPDKAIRNLPGQENQQKSGAHTHPGREPVRKGPEQRFQQDANTQQMQDAEPDWEFRLNPISDQSQQESKPQADSASPEIASGLPGGNPA